MSRTVRFGALAAAGVAVLAVGYGVASRPRAVATGPDRVPTGTAAVTRGTVTERVQVSGVLGYDGSYTVVNQGGSGVLTGAADPGTTVGRGGVLYSVAAQPVRLLFGTVPGYRGFAAGMSDGPDVRELEQNLAALGYPPGTVDDHFSAATAAAIRRWLGTGTLAPGRVVFLPGPLRVAQVQGTLGGAVGPDAPVLTGTSPDRVVTAQLTTDREGLVHAGDRVLVSITGAAPVTGTVLRVGRVATAPDHGGPATVPVTIGVTLPAGGPDLDQAPVQVAIATAEHRDVLLVPVTALLARPGGGYQVRLASGDYVPVQPGLFDDSAGTVEVSGALAPGQRVEVPAS